MSRWNLVLAIVALVQVGLLLALGGESTGEEATGERVGYEPFAELTEERVASLSITDDDLRTVVLERKESGVAAGKEEGKDREKDEKGKEKEKKQSDWVLSSKGGFPIRGGEVKRAIDSLADLRIARELTRSPKNFTSLDVSDSRFARHIVLKATDGGTIGDFYIGDAGHSNTVRYREAGSEIAYEATGVDTWDFNADGSSWIESAFTDIDTAQVTRVRLESAEGSFEIALEEKKGENAGKSQPAGSEKKEGAAGEQEGEKKEENAGAEKEEGEEKKAETVKAWVVVEPALQAGTELDKSKVESLLSSLCKLYVAAPIGKLSDEPAYGFDKCTARAVLTLKDGKVQEITVGAKREDENDYYAKRSGFDYVVTLREWTVTGPFKKKLPDLMAAPEKEKEK